MAEQPSHHEIYERMGNFGGRMDRLEHLVADGFREVKETIRDGLEGVGMVTTDHEKRIRDMEITQGSAKGAWKMATMIGGGAATIAGIVIAVVQWVLG